MSVLLGEGDGTFAAAQNFGVGNQPNSVAIGDLNQDGILDLAVANWSSNDVSVLLGEGDGTFAAAQNFVAGTSPQSVAIGDLNQDGVPDLAVANSGLPGSGVESTVSVLLGEGDGTFGAAQNFVAGASPASVAIGDLNQDGVPDLAVANSGAFMQPGSVSVLLGEGDGTFGAAQNFSTGDLPRSVAIGDLNQDGVPDLAVANRNSDDVSVLLGRGDGTFGAAQNFGAGGWPGPVSVAIGDLNQDGVPDLALANTVYVSVLLGQGDGTFGAAQSFGAGVSSSVAIGDLNQDGVPDLAVARLASANVSVLLGEGDGTFGAAQNFAADDQPMSVAIGDLNQDGVPDLAVANFQGFVSVLLNQL